MREKVSNKGLGTIAFPRIFLSSFTSIGQQFDLAIVLMFFEKFAGVHSRRERKFSTRRDSSNRFPSSKYSGTKNFSDSSTGHLMVGRNLDSRERNTKSCNRAVNFIETLNTDYPTLSTPRFINKSADLLLKEHFLDTPQKKKKKKKEIDFFYSILREQTQFRFNIRLKIGNNSPKFKNDDDNRIIMDSMK